VKQLLAPLFSLRRRVSRIWATLARSDGTQIAEFAISVPLLVVFAVSIYDFGNAFGIKYKLADAVREGARFAASEPTNDLSNSFGGGPPFSVGAIPKVVGAYLVSAKVNDCGLSTATSGVQQSPLVWIYTVNSGCPGSLILTISRGKTFVTPATTLYPAGQTVEVTQVMLSYPYQWQFTNVIKLIAPTSNYASSTTITTSATVQNLN